MKTPPTQLSRFQAVLLSMTVLLTSAACHSKPSKLPPPESRLYIFDDCVATYDKAHDASVGAIASILIPKALDATLTSFGTWLENKAKEQTTSVVASQLADLYVVRPTLTGRRMTPNPSIRCFVYLRGQFGDSKTPDNRGPRDIELKDGALPGAVDDATLLKRFADAGISLTALPEVMIEAAVEYSADKTAWYLQTRYYHVRSFASSASRSPTRGLALTVTLDAPATGGAAASTHSAFVLNFGDREPSDKALVGRAIGKGFESNLQLIPPLREQSAAALAELDAYRVLVKRTLDEQQALLTQQEAKADALESSLAKAAGSAKEKLQSQLNDLKKELDPNLAKVQALRTEVDAKSFSEFPLLMPVTARATLTETESEKKFLMFLAGVFKASKEDLVKSAAAELSPAQRDATEALETKAKNDLLTAVNAAEQQYWQASFDLDIAKQKLSVAPGDLALQKTVKLAEFTFQEAKRQLNLLLLKVNRSPVA